MNRKHKKNGVKGVNIIRSESFFSDCTLSQIQELLDDTIKEFVGEDRIISIKNI